MADRIEELARAVIAGSPLQHRVALWTLACFGIDIASDRNERNHRFLEESLELVQACGCTASEAHQLVDYVYGRPAGDKSQEVGGVMITLAALCNAHEDLDMHAAGEAELVRIWTKVDKIRAKQAAKPKHSPLPAASEQFAPWADFANQPIRAGARMVHPNGQQFTVVRLGGPQEYEEDRWRAVYDDATVSRLGLQIGDKGQAVLL